MTYSCIENFLSLMLFFSLILTLWVYSHGFTLIMRILSSTSFYLLFFNLVSLIIWLTLSLRIWSSLWLYSSLFNLVNLIIWLTLTLRIWSSLWLYSSKLNLMWRFYSYWDFYRLLGFIRWTFNDGLSSWIFFFFCMVNNTFRSFKRMKFIHVGKNAPLFILA